MLSAASFDKHIQICLNRQEGQQLCRLFVRQTAQPSNEIDMKLTFLGAAGEVTGSQHLIETANLRVLLDCGFFQGHRAEARKKNEQFLCRPKELSGVILSHAHADHCGNLPGLYKAGYRGPIFCTPASRDIAQVMLMDSSHIQQEDAKYLQQKLGPGHPPVEPLYDVVEGVMHSITPSTTSKV